MWWGESDRLQNSRFQKAGSAVSVLLKCEARKPHLAVFSLAPAFHSNMVRPSRSQKIRLFCSLGIGGKVILPISHANLSAFQFSLCSLAHKRPVHRLRIYDCLIKFTLIVTF